MQETTWRELAPGVYVRHHEELELNCGLVVGDQRALVIDTRSTAARGYELAAAVREVTDLEQVVVNTHAHYDHCFGNVAFRDSQIYAHADAVEDLRSTAEHQREQVVEHLRRTDREALAQTYLDTEVVLPFYLIADDTPVDLGGRTVHLHHGGRGHTNHDLVISVPDSGVVFWADLVEQGADPAMEDSYPLDWAKTVGTLLALPEVAGAQIHVPGHGEVVDTAFVTRQQATLEALAASLAEALQTGVRDVDALVAKTRGLGLRDATLRDAAVRALETGRLHH